MITAPLPEIYPHSHNAGYREEWERYLGDIKEYPENRYSYTYRNIHIELCRNPMHAWCSYIYITDAKAIEELIPDEITWKDSKCIGFDHAHFDDYCPGMQEMYMPDGIHRHYWTHDETKKRLEEILDLYLDSKDE